MSESLNVRVARALGWQESVQSEDGCVLSAYGQGDGYISGYGKPYRQTDDWACVSEFRPETDWNDAMWAAEQVGLWENANFRFAVASMCLDEDNSLDMFSVKDGPRKICKSILVLKEGETT